MGLHRTFLFLLVVGLTIAAFRRVGDGVSSSSARQTAPSTDAKPALTASALTNSTTGRGLAAGPDSGK